MRKLILQMQTSLDMFVCDENGTTQGFIWEWGPDWTWEDDLQQEFIQLKQSVDCVLLSRKMAEEGFIDHWHRIAQQEQNPASKFAKEVDQAEKIIFSRSTKTVTWKNSRFATQDLANTIQTLKKSEGKNIIAYGGVEFSSELLQTGLIDELIFYVNPIVFGRGKSIFLHIAEKMALRPFESRCFKSGILVIKYKPVQH